MLLSMSRLRSIQFLMGFLFLYLLLMSFEIPLVFKSGFGSGSATVSLLPRPTKIDKEDELPITGVSPRVMREYKNVSGLVFDDTAFDSISKDEFSELHKAARDAFVLGKKVWEEIGSGKILPRKVSRTMNRTESPCPTSVALLGTEFVKSGRVMVVPCGLTLGSHITVVGKPNWAHPEHDPKIALVKEGQSVMVSSFMMELQGLKVVDGEDPPRILHFNPRLKGDWSGRPVIEQNTCYRMQWGSALRCEGWKSKADEETVDGQVKCEKWIRDDDNGSEESKAIWWLSRLIGRTKKVIVNWPYPFAEGKLFVLTLSAGLEGYHVNVDGRHATSFPYRPGFTLEDATGLSIKGDVDVHSIFAATLPASNPNFAPMGHLEMVMKWRAPPLPDGPVELFIGVLSAVNHFAERMAARKSWMQHRIIRSANVVARFFVALVYKSWDLSYYYYFILLGIV